MKLIRSFLSALIAGGLAIGVTLILAEIGEAAGLGRSVHINTAILALCLMAVFGLMRRQAMRREF